MTSFDYSELSPGIQGAIRWFHEQGLETCDSGDGSNYAAGMECAMEEPMVVILPPELDDMINLSDEIQDALEEKGLTEFRVEASYSPGEPAFILVFGESLLELSRLQDENEARRRAVRDLTEEAQDLDIEY